MLKINDTPQSDDLQKQPLAGGTYVLVSLVMLSVAALIAYYMLSHPGGPDNETSDLVYYGVVLILGLAAASFLFGAMRGYARYHGKTSLGSLELGGPVVVAALVIAGFFYERHLQQPFSVRIHVQSAESVDNRADPGLSDLFAESELKTSLPRYQELKINKDGDAFIWDVPSNLKGAKIKLNTIIPGFKQIDPDPNEATQPLAPQGTINVKMKLDPQNDPAIASSQAIKTIAGALQAKNAKLDETEEKNLAYILIRAINLVHPDWTDWVEEPAGVISSSAGVESRITMVPISDPQKSCRGAVWEVRKSGLSITEFARACHKGDFHWEIEPHVGESQSASSAVPEEFLEFVNRTKHEVDVFGTGRDGKPIRYSMSNEGSKRFVQTYAGTSWTAKTKDGKELLLRTKHEHNSSYTANKRYAEIDIVEAH